MAARHSLRLVGWCGAWAGGAGALVSAIGPGGALVGFGAFVVGSMWLVLWLPRAAHARFVAHQHGRAARRYRILGALAFNPVRERAAILSRAGCLIADGRDGAAAALHAGLDTASLAPAERAVWLNNRACAALERDPHGALALVEEAVKLRPDVAAIQHTRGQALLATGRTDDAIAVLDAIRTGNGAAELPPRLEAARCRDLARAWEQKGEVAYAEDYRQRAALLSR